MKGIYKADPTTHAFVSSDLVDDDYQLQANESFDNPSGKEMPAKLVNGAWVDATEEEAAAYQKAQEALLPAQPTTPTPANQATNTLGQQLAQVMQQQTLIMNALNALGQQRAAQDTTKQGA